MEVDGGMEEVVEGTLVFGTWDSMAALCLGGLVGMWWCSRGVTSTYISLN